jgi:hypothetical protein
LNACLPSANSLRISRATIAMEAVRRPCLGTVFRHRAALASAACIRWQAVARQRRRLATGFCVSMEPCLNLSRYYSFSCDGVVEKPPCRFPGILIRKSGFR